MLTSEICKNCFQSPWCEAKNIIGPVTWERVAAKFNLEVTNPPDCWFYCCRQGHMEARHELRNARAKNLNGLIPFGSNHKPFLGQGDTKGRFVAFGDTTTLQTGQITVVHHGQIIKLTHIDNPPLR